MKGKAHHCIPHCTDKYFLNFGFSRVYTAYFHLRHTFLCMHVISTPMIYLRIWACPRYIYNARVCDIFIYTCARNMYSYARVCTWYTFLDACVHVKHSMHMCMKYTCKPGRDGIRTHSLRALSSLSFSLPMNRLASSRRKVRNPEPSSTPQRGRRWPRPRPPGSPAHSLGPAPGRWLLVTAARSHAPRHSSRRARAR